VTEPPKPVVAEAGALDAGADEPPVVARLVVEIRSDGTRTTARGMLEDLVLGERVGVEMRGTTPAAMIASLAKSLRELPALRLPGLLRHAAKALLPRRGSRPAG